jgi:class 3 adenylate cyclase
MGIFKVNKEVSCLRTEKEGKIIWLIKKEKWVEFKSDILGLGTIGEQATSRDVVCAFFDLEGFSTFCDHGDCGSDIPVFLNSYLNWFFCQIQEETKYKEYEDGIATYHDLPFLIKFLGDGLMVLWDVKNNNEPNGIEVKALGNIILSSLQITENYRDDFFNRINQEVGNSPAKLRCGIAKGAVYSVGNGNGQDYVGSCINLAYRLQKLPGITFGFSNKGIPKDAFRKDETRFIKKHVDIRGMGENELISILREEYENLDEKYKKTFTE